MAKRAKQSDRKVTAADVIEFIETCLYVPEGQHVGEPLRLQPWQRDWLKLVYDNPVGRSCARHVRAASHVWSLRFYSLTCVVRQRAADRIHSSIRRRKAVTRQVLFSRSLRR